VRVDVRVDVRNEGRRSSTRALEAGAIGNGGERREVRRRYTESKGEE
jgi:hypothetical protein